MNAGFTIEALSKSHDRSSFSCGSAPLDDYFRERVTQDIKRRVSNCFVVLDGAGSVAAYYTFAATSLPLSELSENETKRLPRYGLLPAGLIGRLAVNLSYRRQGLGNLMIIDAVARAARADPAIYALVVDAKDEAAVGFYKKLGFRQLVSRPRSLFLPIATALQALSL